MNNRMYSWDSSNKYWQLLPDNTYTVTTTANTTPATVVRSTAGIALNPWNTPIPFANETSVVGNTNGDITTTDNVNFKLKGGSSYIVDCNLSCLFNTSDYITYSIYLDGIQVGRTGHYRAVSNASHNTGSGCSARAVIPYSTSDRTIKVQLVYASNTGTSAITLTQLANSTFGGTTLEISKCDTSVSTSVIKTDFTNKFKNVVNFDQNTNANPVLRDMWADATGDLWYRSPSGSINLSDLLKPKQFRARYYFGLGRLNESSDGGANNVLYKGYPTSVNSSTVFENQNFPSISFLGIGAGRTNLPKGRYLISAGCNSRVTMCLFIKIT